MTVSFDDMVHFIDEEDVVTYEDSECGITLYPETPTKIREINRERNYFSRSFKNSKCNPSNDRHNCFIDKQHNSNIFLNPYNLWDMVPAALMSLNHTNGRYYMSNRYLNQQLTNLEQTLIRCSLPREGWTVKGRGCASALHSFNEITYQTDDWTKQLLRLKSWVISGNPERWMEFLRVWWTVIVFKCSHLFHLFDFFCLFVHYLFFFRKFNLFVHFDDFEWELKLHQ